MKSKFPIIVFVLLITPQIALASWWNPFSWFENWGFKTKTDSKTEILEKRIKELESKMGTSTDATSTALTNIKKDLNQNTVTKQKNNEKEIKADIPTFTNDDNISVAVIALYQTHLNLTNSYIKMLKEITINYDTYIDDASKYIEISRKVPNGATEIDIKIASTIESYFQVSKDELILNKSLVNKGIKTFEDEVQYTNQIMANLKGTNIPKSDLDAYNKKIESSKKSVDRALDTYLKGFESVVNRYIVAKNEMLSLIKEQSNILQQEVIYIKQKGYTDPSPSRSMNCLSQTLGNTGYTTINCNSY